MRAKRSPPVGSLRKTDPCREQRKCAFLIERAEGLGERSTFPKADTRDEHIPQSAERPLHWPPFAHLRRAGILRPPVSLRTRIPNTLRSTTMRRNEKGLAAVGNDNAGIEIGGHRSHTAEHVGADGKTRAYCPTRSTLWLTLQDLQVIQQLEPAGGETQTTLSTYIRGTAYLDDCRLAIMGESGNGTRTVHVAFAAREIGRADQHGLREWQDALGTTFSDFALGSARLGYNPPDAQMQEPEKWWVSCHVPENSMRALSDGVEQGRLTAVSVGLCLKNVYVLDQVVADSSGDSRLFLRPGACNDRSESPLTARGYVVHLTLDLEKVSLCRPRENERTHDERSHEGLPLQQRTSTAEANVLGTLAEKLSEAVSSWRWLAVVVAVLAMDVTF
jgi:phosphate:Na+ symporter